MVSVARLWLKVGRLLTVAAVMSSAFLMVQPVQAADLPRVKLLTTGGTIATPIDPATGRPAAQLTDETMRAAIPVLDKVARVEVERFSLIPSTAMGPDVWVKLATRVNEILQEPEIAGVVITHGTDTMEETALFLDLTVASNKPVVLTGAQRSSSAKDADGPVNVLNAVRIAASKDAVGKGVLVAMNGEINAAREVTKSNTWAVETFRSGELGYLGYADPDKVIFYRAPLRRKTLPFDKIRPRVDIVPFYGGADAKFIKAAIQAKVDGIVVAGTGVGNVNPEFDAAIKEAISKGIAVVVATRVPNGSAFPWYDEVGGGGNLASYGAVFADNLSPQKARILLMLALGVTQDPKKLQEIFAP